MQALLERWYKPLFIAFLIGIVLLSYELGKKDAATAAARGVTLSCDQNTLQTLSMKPILDASLTATTATDKTSTTSPENTTTHNFVASKNGTKYYPTGCSAASRIKLENEVWFSNEQDAQLQGYSRTTSC